MSSNSFMRLLPWISTPLLLLAIVIAWELYVRYSGISEYVVPAPADAWASLVALLREPAARIIRRLFGRCCSTV